MNEFRDLLARTSFLSMAENLKSSNDRDLFDTFFPGLVDDIVKECENDREIGDAVRHIREVILNLANELPFELPTACKHKSV